MRTTVIFAGLTAILLLFIPAHAQFGGGHIVFDPSMFARQAQQLRQETQTVLIEAQQLKNMVQNTVGGYSGLWGSNQKLLDNLGNLISVQEGLSYTFDDLTSQFQKLYPGYQTTTTPGAESPQTVTETTLNTLNGTLASAQAQAQNFEAEQTQLEDLESRNNTATGRMQEIQVSNEIALAQVQQIQMLRQLVIAMMNAQNTAAASQINNQVQSSLAAEAILSAPPSPDFPDWLHSTPGPPPVQP